MNCRNNRKLSAVLTSASTFMSKTDEKSILSEIMLKVHFNFKCFIVDIQTN